MRLLAITLFLAAAFCIAAPPLEAQIAVSGGSPRERAELQNVLHKQLSGLVLPHSPVALNLVDADQMRRIVHAGPQSDIRSRSSDGPDGIRDTADDDVDGIYDDAPPVITLLSGNPAPDLDLTFVHEYGHHVWAQFLLSSDRDEYRAVYARQAQAHTLVTEYAEDSPEEGFAEAFAYYVLQPKRLARRDPASYQYMSGLVSRLRAACAAMAADDSNFSPES